jgi:cell wall-associated NlpC family hydrolase
VASHRLKRTMRGALAASAVVAAVSFTPAPATADTPAPPPPASNDPVAQYRALSGQADALNEKMDDSNVQLAKQQGMVRKATTDVGLAKAAEKVALGKEDKYLDQVDKLTDASFEGARLSQVSALLTGTSAQDFLNRATDLQALADDNYAALSKFADAVDAAKAAEARAQQDLVTAQDATAAAKSLQGQLIRQGAQLQTQITKLTSDRTKFTPKQLAELANQGIEGAFIAPPGLRGRAMEIALAQRGKEYVWAAAGPNQFDCSGLMIYAMAHAGYPGLPHSSAALSQMGTPVARADLQPGDMVFFGHPVHHVGMYVGDGLMINAPSFGEPVRVQALDSDYEGGRRIG